MLKGYVYILASKRNGTLYTGVTRDISRRMFEHKNDLIDGFYKKYAVHQLLHLEKFDRLDEAILREKQIKEWRRSWKIELIEESNPDWKDLTPDIQ